MNNEYNVLPKNSTTIECYNDFEALFTYIIEENDFRQPIVDKKVYDLRIFWINKDNGLGYGIARDSKNKKIIHYKFGREEDWSEFISYFSRNQY